MGDWDTELLRGEGTGDGGVDISNHNHQIRPVLQEDLLISHHNPGCLFGVGPRPHTQVIVGPWNAQFLKEDAGHVGVVVLAGVDNPDLKIATPPLTFCLLFPIAPSPSPAFLHRLYNRRDLHEVGPCPGDEMDDAFFHGSPSISCLLSARH